MTDEQHFNATLDICQALRGLTIAEATDALERVLFTIHLHTEKGKLDENDRTVI